MELLAPGGDEKAVKAAIAAGANAVYVGINKFNARNRAENISIETLLELIQLAHISNCQIFLTLNTLIYDNEFSQMTKVLNRLVNSQVDAVIVQDLGLIYYLKKHFPTLLVHASTQNTTHNSGQVSFLKQQGALRVNLCRELNRNEIQELITYCKTKKIETEIFIHGSNCVSFSGACMMSSFQNGNSGNRGRCSQPCRDRFNLSGESEFLLNLKDRCLAGHIMQLLESGADSLKIEGRIKKFHYVYGVVKEYRKLIDHPNNEYSTIAQDTLSKLFNREFTDGFYTGNLSSDLFINDNRDRASHTLMKTDNTITDIQSAKKWIYDYRTEIIQKADQAIKQIPKPEFKLHLNVYGKEGSPLKIELLHPTFSGIFQSKSYLRLAHKNKQVLTPELLLKNMKQLNETAFYIESIDNSHLQNNLSLPLKELTDIRHRLFSQLHQDALFIKPITYNKKPKSTETKENSSLIVLTDSLKDVEMYLHNDEIQIYFEIPTLLSEIFDEILNTCKNYPSLNLWFPTVLLEKDFQKAVELLKELRPKSIIANNSGVALAASQFGIEWIAGPAIHCTNSFALQNLSEQPQCKGAFISSELSPRMVANLRIPQQFELYGQLYGPQLLMTSRACLAGQTTACPDSNCKSNKSQCSTQCILKDEKGDSYHILKRTNHFSEVYSNTAILNTSLIEEHDSLNYSLLVDIRNTPIRPSQITGSELLSLFQAYVKNPSKEKERVLQALSPISIANSKYAK